MNKGTNIEYVPRCRQNILANIAKECCLIFYAPPFAAN